MSVACLGKRRHFRHALTVFAKRRNHFDRSAWSPGCGWTLTCSSIRMSSRSPLLVLIPHKGHLLHADLLMLAGLFFPFSFECRSKVCSHSKSQLEILAKDGLISPMIQLSASNSLATYTSTCFFGFASVGRLYGSFHIRPIN